MTHSRVGGLYLNPKTQGVVNVKMKVVSFQRFGDKHLPYDDKGVRLFFDRGGGYVPVLATVLTSVG